MRGAALHFPFEGFVCRSAFDVGASVIGVCIVVASVMAATCNWAPVTVSTVPLYCGQIRNC